MEKEKFMVNGFKASAVASGLKKDGALDLALIYSEKISTVAGVFTKNKVVAAPVILCREYIQKGKAKAIIANAGNANACSGEVGLGDARLTTELVAKELNAGPDEVFVASTGVIGQPLNMPLISKAIPKLVDSLSPDGVNIAAEAIMTTDSFPKLSSFEGMAGEKPYRIVGIAKGAGMIMPDMATMLSFILTDIEIDGRKLNKALVSVVDKTFNRITVDGDTSTNDTVLAMANGMAENGTLSENDLAGFENGLTLVMGELARMIARDGEGATKLVDIEVKGANSADDAIIAARTVANSPLVKTAFYGQDPNWGRIMGALGRAGIEMDERTVDIFVDDIQIVSEGLGRGSEQEKLAAEKMLKKEFTVTIDLNKGPYKDRMITCDFTHEYISINADYRT